MKYLWAWVGCALAFFTPWSQAQETYGKAEDPVVAEVHGVRIKTTDGEEMTYVIQTGLLQYYTEQQGIEATDAEIREYIVRTNALARKRRKEDEARYAEIVDTLKSDKPSAAERESLQSELDTFETIRKYQQDADQRRRDDPESDAAEKEVARAFVDQWKVNQALYRQYGGRVIYQQGGAEPLDAYREFYEEAQKKGDFKIFEKRFEPVFWKYYRTDSMHSFYPDSGDEKDKAINTPWWRMESPPRNRIERHAPAGTGFEERTPQSR